MGCLPWTDESPGGHRLRCKASEHAMGALNSTFSVIESQGCLPALPYPGHEGMYLLPGCVQHVSERGKRATISMESHYFRQLPRVTRQI